MNYEQLCYLRTVIPCRDKELFEAFDKAANLHAKIKAFEAGVRAAWKSFIDEQALQSSAATPPNQYTKPGFEDFGATPAAEAPNSRQMLDSGLQKAEALPPVKVGAPIEYHQNAASYAQATPGPQSTPQPHTSARGQPDALPEPPKGTPLASAPPPP